MAFVPVPNAVEVEARMLLDGQKIENTLGFQHFTTFNISDLEVLALDVIGWWTTKVAPITPADLTLVEVVITDLTTDTSPQWTEAPSEPIAGTFAGNALPNNVSLAVSFRTANRGRSNRGRNYVPCLMENQVVNNTVSGATVTQWLDVYNSIPTLISGPDTSWTWSVISKYSGVDSDGKPIPRSEGVTTPITAAVVVDPTVDSMRRRLPGRGR